METQQECRGCGIEKSFFTYGTRCHFKSTSNIRLCPCKECLVKVICRLFCDSRAKAYIEMLEIIRRDTN